MATVKLQWGRPTQAERDATEIHVVAPEGPPGAQHDAEILVYISGLETGKKYHIRVGVKEKGNSENVEKIKAKNLDPAVVPVLPPADPRTP